MLPVGNYMYLALISSGDAAHLSGSSGVMKIH